MDHEEREEPIATAAGDELQKGKSWVTPVVSESPVNELTSASTAVVLDGAAYS